MTQTITSGMKRSKTTYTPSNSSTKSFSRDILELSPRNRKATLSASFSSFSSHNASWGQSSTCQDRQRHLPLRSRNIFLQNDQEINGLLTMLRTNDFSGEIDPVHHSQYMKAPKVDTPEPRPRRLGDSYHRSDGHLLHMNHKSAAIRSGV